MIFVRNIEDMIPKMNWSIGSVWNDVVGGGSDRTSAEATTSAAAAAAAQAKTTQTQAISAVTPTAEQLLALSNQYANASSFMSSQISNLQNNMNLLNSTQPALMQAGIQAYQLMTGQQAASLAPIQNERSLQRTQLQNSLEAKLGSGYATSSAGIEALNQFDQQTSNLMTNAQQSAIAQYLGVSASVMPNMVNLTNSVFGTGSNLNAAAIGESQSAAALMSNAITGTGQNLYNSAGAPWAGQAQLANSQSQFSNAIFGTVLGFAGKASGGGGGSNSGAQSYNGLNSSNDSSTFTMPQGQYGQYGGSGTASAMAP